MLSVHLVTFCGKVFSHIYQIDVRNLFRFKKTEKETNDAAIKGIKNRFRLKKENKAIKDRKYYKSF